jgi:hypothetical protein
MRHTTLSRLHCLCNAEKWMNGNELARMGKDAAVSCHKVLFHHLLEVLINLRSYRKGSMAVTNTLDRCGSTRQWHHLTAQKLWLSTGTFSVVTV